MASTGIDRIAGTDPFVAIKAPCACATTANITLSGSQTVDTLVVAETTPKTRVFVRSQTNAAENGIYDVYDTAWVRSPDFNGSRDVVDGTLISVVGGSAYLNSTWRVTTSDPIVIGTTSLSFESILNYNDGGMAFLSTFALLGSTAATLDQVVYIKGHTTAGIGAGQFIAKAGSVTTVSGIRINSATANLYFERMVLHDIYDPWMTGATGVKAADEAAILICINEIKANNRGTLIIPSKISATAIVPAPALGNSQSIDIIDLRMDRTGGVQAFGVEEHWIEGKDSGGGYASEFRIKGKQNPGFSMYPLSDGTAIGYPYANNMTSIVGFNNAGENNAQWLTDPYSKGYKGDWAFEQYSAGAFTVSISMYAGVDLNKKTRFDLTPIQLSSAAINISSITNTTPIVVNTATPHNMVGQYGPVGILGTAITALNGSSWIAQNTGASQLTLLNSVASGAGGAVGTIGVQKNSQRATLNVPAIQGGTEAIVAEGKVVATGTSGQFVSEVATGTAPIDVTSTTPCINVNANPICYNAAGTQQVNCHEVKGFVSLAAGTATVTLSGNAVFTSDSTFNTSAVDHTAAAAVHVVHNSGSSITFNGTGTHLIGYRMNGN